MRKHEKRSNIENVKEENEEKTKNGGRKSLKRFHIFENWKSFLGFLINK